VVAVKVTTYSIVLKLNLFPLANLHDLVFVDINDDLPGKNRMPE